MIPLMKNAFLKEHETKAELAKFIVRAKRLSMDEQCMKFEEEFAAFQGAREAVLFSSGSCANLAMLQAMKNLGMLKTQDKVGFSALTWATNVMPIIQLGFTPVPIDCEPKTLNVMKHNVEQQLETEDIKLLFLTNALGFSGDLDAIRELCRKKNIVLLEDNCEALGTELECGVKTGNFGIMSSYSFFVAHHMSTIEGGMVCTNNQELAEMLRIVRANGWDRNLNAVQQRQWRRKHNILSEFQAKYTFYDLGYNFRPTEITAFIGRYQMKFLADNIHARERNYRELSDVVKTNPDLISFSTDHLKVISSFSFPVLCQTPELRESYLDQFAGAGVEIRPMIAGNIQKQPFYQKYMQKEYDLPGADFIHACGFYCGNYPELTYRDIQILKSCLAKY